MAPAPRVCLNRKSLDVRLGAPRKVNRGESRQAEIVQNWDENDKSRDSTCVLGAYTYSVCVHSERKHGEICLSRSDTKPMIVCQ